MIVLAKVIEVCRRLRYRFDRRRMGRALDEEMRLHLELRARANQALGMSAEEARSAASASFGDPAVLLRECHDVWVGRSQARAPLGFFPLVLAAFMALGAINDFFAPALAFAHRTGALGVAEMLGRATAGDDYRRFVPLIEAVPPWLHGLWVLAGISYLLAIARIVGRRPRAHLLVLGAVGLELVAMLVSRPIEAAAGVVVNPNPCAITTVVLPFGLPLALAAVLWGSERRMRGRGCASLLET